MQGEIEPLDFYAWVKQRLMKAGVTIAALSQATGIVYSTLNRSLNSGAKGEPTRSRRKTVTRIIPALVELGVIENPAEGWIAAGYSVRGYRVISEADEQAGACMTPQLDEIRKSGYPDLPERDRREVLRTIAEKLAEIAAAPIPEEEAAPDA